jgi:LAO/AO transport system kinase
MRDVSTASGIFIRSMATRGTLGGLCQGARDVARILDAAGHELVLIETVGVGQDEIEVVKAADIVAVVCVPGQGDGIQTLKAGIMEIADLFVVNKADREGAEELVADIRSMLTLGGEPDGEKTPVLETCALSGEGVEALVAALLERADRSGVSSERSEGRVREEILTLIERELARVVRRRFGAYRRLDEAVKCVQSGESDPYSAAEAILDGLGLVESTGAGR